MSEHLQSVVSRLRQGARTPDGWLVALVIVAVWALPYAPLASDSIGAVAEAGLMCAGLALCLLRRRLLDPAVILVLTIMAFWVLLGLLLPNVPSLYVAGLGVRKTTMALTGVVVAIGLPATARRTMVLHVAASLVAALSVSIALHTFAPSVEAGVVRTAGADTDLYLNEARLQGVFPGPFHAALAAVLILILIPVVARRSRAAAAVTLVVGASGLFLTSVRSAIIAVGAGLLALALSGGDRRQRLQRGGIVAAAGAALVLAAVVFGGARIRAALGSLLTPWDDSRLLNRLEFYREGWSLVSASPVYGWGPGSAGDTMETYFVGAHHVNSHNLGLKLLIEGGVVGLALWLGLLGLLVVRLWRARNSDLRAAGIGALVALLVYGLTGSAIEALPVSTYLLMVVTLATLSPPSDEPRTGDEDDAEETATVPATERTE